MNRRDFLTLSGAVAVLAPLQPLAALAAVPGFSVVGGGESIITGGNGAAVLGDLVPLKTIFSFQAKKPQGGVASGRFECLALAPSGPSGADSGLFTQNIMYVTGVVTSLQRLNSETALIKGQGRCSGVGAGDVVLFEAQVTRGGPGATIRLTVDTLPGVEFFEIVISGSIKFSD